MFMIHNTVALFQVMAERRTDTKLFIVNMKKQHIQRVGFRWRIYKIRAGVRYEYIS